MMNKFQDWKTKAFKCQNCGMINSHGNGDAVSGFTCWACAHVHNTYDVKWVQYHLTPSSKRKGALRTYVVPLWK